MIQGMKIQYPTILIAGLLILFSCGDESSPASRTTNPKPAQASSAAVVTPEFSGDSAYVFVQTQVDFGPRVPNSLAHIQCGNWLLERFKSYDAKVTTQETVVRAYDGAPLKAKNIIAAYRPEKANRIILSAHWDTRPIADAGTERVNQPIDGANDGGSGVGVLLELARMFSQQLPTIGVDIILWDAEDYGMPGVENSYCLGSQYWAKNKHKANYQARYGINLDMVGAENARFLREGYSMNMASAIVQKVWMTGQRLGYGQYFDNQRVGAIIDDHVYMNSPGGVQSIDVIHMTPSGGFFGAWHTHGDDMSVISKNTLKAVGQTVAEVVYQEK